jgi:DNA mismatch repair protein MutS
VLSADEKNYLSAVVPAADGFALAAVDVSTGEFRVAQLGNSASLMEEIRRLAPREILASPKLGDLSDRFTGLPLTRLEDSYWEPARAAQAMARRFGPRSESLPAEMALAAGVALLYLEQTFGAELAHLRAPEVHQASQYLQIDEVSRAHLELVVSSDGTRKGSLLSVLDQTRTAAGARTLAGWLLYPLLDIDAIHRRQDAIEELFDADLGGAISAALGRIGDLERLVGRVASLKAGPRDCLRLGLALEAVAELKQTFDIFRSEELRRCAGALDPMAEVAAQIAAALVDEPPMTVRDGGVIRQGYHGGVDELRTLSLDARSVIARLEARERERTGIGSLKVRYNQVFGYYLEITKAHLERVPSDYERKQTLVGAERFTTPELKELERKILSAESGLKELEAELFLKLLRAVAAHVEALARTARAAGELDCLVSLALVARHRAYVRPIISNAAALSVSDGRHPVLEAGLKRGEFVPNDLEVDSENRQLLLITGPNMAGKSTYLRQVALIVIMAQAGSFVPATQATLGLVDRIFTRIGARDDLRRGESTFMVEMRETARLLAGLGERSLLLLDEVGRGTSTFDGLAIAWSLAEFLHDRTRARILFATHFHELTDLARERPRVKNLCMAVREWGGDVVFLRRVVEGAASRSYGIEVAKLAGLPETLLLRAREILNNLEQGELDANGMPRLARGRQRGADAQARQMDLFSPAERRTIDELRGLDPDRLTPIEALNALSRLSALLESREKRNEK